MIARFKRWRIDRRLNGNQRLFQELYRDDRSGMRAIVEAAGYKVGCSIAMSMLDRLRIQHCVMCPEIMPLRNHPLGKMCSYHYQHGSTNPTPTQEDTHGVQDEGATRSRSDGHHAAASRE